MRLKPEPVREDTIGSIWTNERRHPGGCLSFLNRICRMYGACRYPACWYDSHELGEYENSEEALAAAEAFISTHGNEVNDEEDGIGSVIYWTVEVERRVEYKENEWLPCDESGRIDDGYGNEPNATVAYLSSLEGSREERAFELAKNEYLAWLEHKADRYTTVYGYMGLGDRYEQHLL